MKDNKLYTTGEIAEMCQVTINAVKKWIAAGKIIAFRTPGGHYRISKDDLLVFLGNYKVGIKDDVFPELKRVLVVDDDPGVLEFIRGALESMPIRCLIETASDGYEALIKVGDFKPEILILDLRMPKLDGFEVCRRLKSDSSTSRLKVLAVTAHGQEDMKKILSCGADDCMAKPLKLKDFQKSVAQLLR